VAQTETTVLLKSLGESSKRNRKSIDGSFSSIGNSEEDSTSGSRRRSDTTIQTLVNEIKSFGTSPTKKLKVALETTIELKIVEHIQSKDIAQLLHEARLSVYDFQNFDIAEIDLLVNIYCSPNRNFDSEYVKNEFQELGLSKLVATKLYKYLHDIMITLIK
jgi:hypothetical protein